MLNDDYLYILNELQRAHAIFAEFWRVGRLREDSSLQTAAIYFDQIGKEVTFAVNPQFWESLSIPEKCFILAHECLHVYFGHGKRMISLADSIGHQMKRDDAIHTANIAADLVVNHYLVNAFNFDRNDLEFSILDGNGHKGVNNLVWVDTIFPKQNIPTGQSLEFYFYLLIQQNAGSGAVTIDEHSGLEAFGMGGGNGGDQEEQDDQALKELFDSITGRMSIDELDNFVKQLENSNPEDMKTAQQAGTMAGDMVKLIQELKKGKKKKWETVVKDVLGRFKGKERDITFEQWARKNRRMATVSSDLLMPSEISDILPTRDRIDVWFFQDTSGSCVDYAERFFAAARSIPEDRFKIRAFCFDTRTYEIDLKKGELKGFGGTSFNIIEDRIQNTIKSEGCLYPQAVFIITDGYGSPVDPQFPKTWHWFLTSGSTKSYIPKECHVYSLNDFEFDVSKSDYIDPWGDDDEDDW